MDNSLVLWINAGIWVLTLIYWVNRNGIINAGVVALGLYTMMAIVTIHLFYHPMAFYDFEQNVTLFPFIYLYIMLMLMLYPVLKLDTRKISYIKLPTTKFISVCCLVIIFCVAYNCFEILPNISEGLVLLLTDEGYGSEAYSIMNEEGLGKTAMTGGFDIIGIIANACMSFSIPFCFIYLLLPKKNIFILSGMIFAVLIEPIRGLSIGSRVYIVTTLLIVVFMFVFLCRYMSKKLIGRICLIGGTGLICLIVFFVALSNSRARGEEERANYMYERYFAESFLIFNQYCLDANGTREGTWVAPLFGKMIGKPIYSILDQRFVYKDMKVDNSRFSTFVGDFVLDFGPVLAALIFIILSILFYRGLRCRNVINPEQIMLLYILLKILSGFYLHQFTQIAGNLVLIYYLLAYFVLKTKYFKQIGNYQIVRLK